jgi:hypothetical protein
MKRLSLISTGAALCLLLSNAATADVIVNGFGAGNWKSWDTRDISGTRLLGTSDSHPGWPGGSYSAANDPLIEKQIKFMGEGLTVQDAAGGTPDPSPTGSLNGLGYVRLDGTSGNSGKSDISYITGSPIASPTALLAGNFYADYRYYTDSNPTSRTPGLNIGMINGASQEYTFNHVQLPYVADSWNTEVVDNTASLFSLFGPGAPGGAVSQPLAAWASDSTWGPIIFGDASNVIYRVGFNIGSSQRNALIYMDWMSTSLMGGQVNDFQNVPEPGTFVLAGIGAIAVVGLVRRKRAKR